MKMTEEKKRRPFTGIWEVQDARTNARITRFRSFKRRDIDLQLSKASIGLKRPLTDFEAVFIADWVDDAGYPAKP